MTKENILEIAENKIKKEQTNKKKKIKTKKSMCGKKK